MRRAYQTLLRLYPRDFRAPFAAEMLLAFDTAAAESRAKGQASYFRFAIRELAGALTGAGAEWIAKLTTDSSVRGRILPDRLMMRPPGVPWEAYYGDALENLPAGTLPHEVVEAQRLAGMLVKRIVHAIAHHDFAGARAYCHQERQARENLRLLREKYKCSPDTWQSA